MTRPKPSICTTFRNNMVFLILASMGLLCLVWIQAGHSSFKRESRLLRQEFVNSQEQMIRSQVSNVADYIRYVSGLTEQRLRDTLQGEVYRAHQIAANIYEANKDGKSAQEIGGMIRDALRPVRFNQGRGYYFAASMDGVDQLFPVRPELEGQNVLDLQDAQGGYVVREEIQLVRLGGEGFVQGFWPKPDKDPATAYPKISFVKYFEPLDWYLGAGEYLDDYDRQVQAEVLDRVVDLRFGAEGYFFGSTYDGGPLFSNGKITRGTGSLLDLTDPNGVKIFQEYREAALRPGGGVVYYVWPKLNNPDPCPKMSFVMGIERWKWIIGAGVYLDSIDKTIAQNEAKLMGDFQQNLFRSLLALSLLLCFALLWVRRLSRRVQVEMDSLTTFFRRAATHSLTIDPEELHYVEFGAVAHSANTMLRDRLQAEDSLRQSEEKYRELVQAANSIILRMDPGGRVTFFNDFAQRFFGYSEEEILGRNVVGTIVPETDSSGRDLGGMVQDILKRPACYELNENENMRKDGSRVWVTWSNKVVVDADGACVEILCVGCDITERKKAQEERARFEAQLQQAQKMEAVGTLAGGIAHDFNNVLGAIMGYTELSLMEVSQGSPARASMEEVLKASQRAKSLVKQILTFSRQHEQSRKPLLLSHIIQEASGLIRASLPSTIEIRKRLPKDEGPVMADPTQMHQIIMNLCSNAGHAMEKDGGVLEIALDALDLLPGDAMPEPSLSPGRYVRLSVSDTGRGIPPEALERIFDPYFTTKEQDKGTGLGLAVVHGIVKSHRGSISVHSEEGWGTTFRVYLPEVAAQEQSAPPRQDKAALPLGAERVLFVDDEEPLVNMGSQMLQRLGYKVTTCMDSMQALAMFKQSPHDFDLVITDQTMPRMTGKQLAEALWAIRPEIPVILCTGFSAGLDEKQARAMGVKAFLMKPLNYRKLADAVRRALDQDG